MRAFSLTSIGFFYIIPLCIHNVNDKVDRHHVLTSRNGFQIIHIYYSAFAPNCTIGLLDQANTAVLSYRFLIPILRHQDKKTDLLFRTISMITFSQYRSF